MFPSSVQVVLLEKETGLWACMSVAVSEGVAILSHVYVCAATW